jgi:hypothetical protein
MRTLDWLLFILLLTLGHSLPVFASGDDCVEIWDYNTSRSFYVVNLDTGTTTAHEYTANTQYASPDNRYSLQYTAGSGSTLMLHDLHTGAIHTIADYADGVAWSRDGLRFIYYDAALQGEQALMLYEIASATSRFVSENIPIGLAQLSDDGQWITYRQEVAAGQYNLVLYNIAADTERVVAQVVILEQVGWSPDGLWLTRIQGASRQATRFELILYNVITAAEMLYSFESPVSEASFAWSPTGLQIALAVKTDIVPEYSAISILSAPELDVVGAVSPLLERIELFWSPTGQSLLLSARDSADFMLVNVAVQPLTVAEIRLGTHAPRYVWSPDATYLTVYYGPGDHATSFALLNRQGEIRADNVYVPSSQYDFVARHWWIDAHHLLINEWVDGFDTLILLDARTGTRQTLFNPFAGLWVDGKRIALIPATLSPSYEVLPEVQFYVWTDEQFTLVRTVPLPNERQSMLWRADSSELLILFEDETLKMYNYEAETWRLITTLPVDADWNMRSVKCAG